VNDLGATTFILNIPFIYMQYFICPYTIIDN
jgi:hypothetical protein